VAGFLERNISAVAGAIERSVASERWCRERGFLQAVDARVKIVSLLALLIACSLAHDILILIVLYAVATALAFASRIGLGAFTKRVWVFIPLFTGVVAIPALFLIPGTRIASAGPFVVTLEGVKTALLLILRVSSSVCYAILLILTTPWAGILQALRRMRVPALVVSLIALSYRYMLLLLRTLGELFLARKSRIIKTLTLRAEIGFMSRSVGFLFLKSLHVAEGVHMAMVSRGFDDALAWDSTGRAPSSAPPIGENVFELEKVSYAHPGGIPGIAVERLSIPRGSCTALLGPNGSGKSTLLTLLDGLVFPQTGVVRGLGIELTERALESGGFRTRFRSTVGLLFQDADIQCFSPTVREELAFGPRQQGLDEKDVDRRVEAALAALGIEEIAERYPYALSGGEKKRVAIASILTLDLDVYLLDEPTANLDPATEGILIDILAGLAENGKTLVVATQDLVLAQHIADMAVVLGHERHPLFIGPIEQALGDAALLEKAGLAHGHRHPHRRAGAAVRHSHYTEEKKP
jgi:cobalt ECF transporter T component CbiQ